VKRRECGGLLEPRVTDLPFKIGESSIVVVKALPVLKCRGSGWGVGAGSDPLRGVM